MPVDPGGDNVPELVLGPEPREKRLAHHPRKQRKRRNTVKRWAGLELEKHDHA